MAWQRLREEACAHVDKLLKSRRKSLTKLSCSLSWEKKRDKATNLIRDTPNDKIRTADHA